MDPLSEVLSLLKPRSVTCGGFDFGGQWAIRFPQHPGIKLYALISGNAWMQLEGDVDPIRVEAGDCFLLTRGRPFRLANDLHCAPVDAITLFSPAQNGQVRVHQGGGDCLGAGGHFTFNGPHAEILLRALPPVVHIRREADREAMCWSLERITRELREQLPGSFLVVQQLAFTMLVQALRLHLAEGMGSGVGWLSALGDRQISAAIQAMHQAPAHRWTLQELAARAGMSRSVFAQRFKQASGESAMEYLTRCRMMLAADRMANTRDPISDIAPALGYESGSAFSTAFKRVMGCSPRQYSQRHNPARATPQERPLPPMETLPDPLLI